MQAQEHFFPTFYKTFRRFPHAFLNCLYCADRTTISNTISQISWAYRDAFLCCPKWQNQFFFSSKHAAVLVLIVTPRRTFLTTDIGALQGILAHELMHLRHMQQDVYQRLHATYLSVWRSFLPRVKKLHRAGAVRVIRRVGLAAEFLLKDLYVNSSLIQQNYSHALLTYYFREFQMQKVCPRPVFYDKLQRAIHKDIHVLEDVFVFEFALLSIILPFQKYHPIHARRLLSYIERCYQLNITEITRKCGPLVTYYLQHYHKPSPQFEQIYFTLIFEKIYELLL